MAGARFFGLDLDRAKNAAELAAALGGLKGPIMKVAQLLATIPEALPPEYITELTKLQSQAPPMGWAFVKRRMQAELGAGLAEEIRKLRASPGRGGFARAGASRPLARRRRACLQAAICRHAVGGRSRPAAARHRCSRSAAASIPRSTPREIIKEIGARVREELDYKREAKHVALYRDMLDGQRLHPRAESVARALDRPAAHARLARRHAACSTTRTSRSPCATGSRTAMFTAWWFPFSRFGVIHGDPHLGNYTVFEEKKKAAGINLLDYGCIRIFPPSFVGGVVDLYNGLLSNTYVSKCTRT